MTGFILSKDGGSISDLMPDSRLPHCEHRRRFTTSASQALGDEPRRLPYLAPLIPCVVCPDHCRRQEPGKKPPAMLVGGPHR